MKKITFYILGMLYLLNNFEIAAQRVTKDGYDPNKYVYWFFIRAESKFDKETKRPVYVVRILSKTPKSGTLAVYEKEVWRYLQGGQQLAIGPFYDYNDARRAIAAYDLARLPKERMDEELGVFKDTYMTSDDYYWYFLKFRVAQRTGKFIFERTAARVDFGDINQFLQVFLEGVTFEQLAIGPFATQIEAEESKRLNRLEEK